MHINSMHEFNTTMIITDGLTGEVILNLPIRKLSENSLQAIICDLLAGDTCDRHGFIIKYGNKTTT